MTGCKVIGDLLTYIYNCEEANVAPKSVYDGHKKDGLPHIESSMNEQIILVWKLENIYC